MNPYLALHQESLYQHRIVARVWLAFLVGAPVVMFVIGLIASDNPMGAIAAVDGWVMTPQRVLSWYVLPTLLFFWGGQSAFRAERTSRADVWLRTVPVSDRLAVLIRLAVGLELLLAVAVLHFWTIRAIEIVFLLSRGLPTDGRGLGYILTPGWDAWFLFATLAPFYLAGAAGRLTLSRNTPGRILLLVPILWIVGVFALGMWSAASVMRDPSQADVMNTWMVPGRSLQATLVLGHLAVATAFALLAWWRASRVEIVA